LMALNETMEVVRGSNYAKSEYNISTGTGQIFTYAFVGPALALSTLERGRPPKDWKEFMGDLFAYNISMLPAVGPLISGALLLDKWSSDGSPIYFEFLNSTKDVVVAAMKLDGEKLTSESIRLAAMSTGFPAKLVRFLEKIGEGQFDEGGKPDYKAIATWYTLGEKLGDD